MVPFCKEYFITLEMGRVVTSDIGCYITKIVDIRNRENNLFYIVNGGIHHISYYGQVNGSPCPRCTHDAEGGCTMCNYGKGHDVDETAVIHELAGQIEKLPEKLQELIVTPSRSMLDDAEVPEAMRKKIFGLLEHRQCEDFYIETRADSITRMKRESLRDCVKLY